MIQSVDRAAAILTVLSSGSPRLGVTEIADRVGLAKTTVHGLLRTLVQHDLVIQDPDTGKYSLGAGVLRLGNAYLYGSDLRMRSQQWARELAITANEAVWVATLSGTRVIVIHHVRRPDTLAGPGAVKARMTDVGAAIPWHACALGHAIVAHLPAEDAARVLAADRVQLTGRTKTSRAMLAQVIARVRRVGYAIENQEAAVGDAGIAAPVLTSFDTVAGAIGLTGPAARMLRPDVKDDLARAVVDAARAVSRSLGAPGSHGTVVG